MKVAAAEEPGTGVAAASTAETAGAVVVVGIAAAGPWEGGPWS